MTRYVRPVRSHLIDQSILLHYTQSGSIHLKVLHVHYTMDKVNRSAPSNMQRASVARTAVDGIKCIYMLYRWTNIDKLFCPKLSKHAQYPMELWWYSCLKWIKKMLWDYKHTECTHVHLSSKQQCKLPNHMNKTDKSEKQKPSSESTISSVMIWIR